MTKNAETHHQDSGLALQVRVGWMLIGTGVLAGCAISIWISKAPFFSIRDLVFWSMVGITILLRFIDITRFCGTTGTGEPATMAHWRRYAVLLLVCSLGLWVIVHFASVWI